MFPTSHFGGSATTNFSIDNLYDWPSVISLNYKEKVNKPSHSTTSRIWIFTKAQNLSYYYNMNIESDTIHWDILNTQWTDE
jgi:hypothetical protein